MSNNQTPSAPEESVAAAQSEIVFEACGTFGALHKAETWIRSNGYSKGSLCGGDPMIDSILHGAAVAGTTDITDALIFLALGSIVALAIWLGRMAVRFLRGPAPVPQDAQAFPYPIIVHMSMGQRLDARQAAEVEAQWELWKQIEEMTR